ncbi:MAG: 50S ribosomal protein L25 [Candidatus Parcubacteria bacterium]|nr:50S ribosomal protein L25 [Candidatus Parcubacteria bacterium]
MLKLNIQERDLKDSAASFRTKGLLPCVYYGPKDKPITIVTDRSEFVKVLKQAGESTVVSLVNGKEEIEVLIHDVSYDPVKGQVIHVDFYVPEKGKTVEVEVPIEFVGVSGAVKDMGGTLVKVLHGIEVEALPKDLPKNVTVDISVLKDLESQILAKDITLPAGVTLITDPEEVVASISAAEEEEAVAVADIASIEVAKKGKKEETVETKK